MIHEFLREQPSPGNWGRLIVFGVGGGAEDSAAMDGADVGRYIAAALVEKIGARWAAESLTSGGGAGIPSVRCVAGGKGGVRGWHSP